MPMKKDSFDISNPYVRRARFQPAMLIALPLALATLALSPNGIAGWGAAWSAFVFCGGTALMAQLARDKGKSKESWLYERWSGKPTTRLLRHRDAPNKIVLSRRHKKLQAIVPDIHIPTEAEEQASPRSADEVYDACTAYLLERTRKKEAFPLVFEENCNYGFRRNLWGMKPFGIVSSIIGCGVVISAILLDYRTGVLPSPTVIVCGAINLSLLLVWAFWLTPSWVRIPAEAFAERLLSSCESL